MSQNNSHNIKRYAVVPLALVLLGFSTLSQGQLFFPNQEAALIERGRLIFFNETFNGNGRTCGTCHRAENNMTLDPAFIATLPDTDPLFVAEFNPDLQENFENPRLMREFGLILENQDGFNDLASNFNMGGVPHVLAQRTSIDIGPPPDFRTGWGGDGAPDDDSGSPPLDGSLRAFAIGAVRQHFTKTLARVPGPDFRFPTEHELDALEAFQLSLGRQSELTLPLPLKGTVAQRGQEIFRNLGPGAGGPENGAGKCNACHFNAGANVHPIVAGALGIAGNLNFATGVEDLPDQPQDLTGELVPPDDGFGSPGKGEFNTPPLVEAADTGPFFHNNAVETIEGAVAFYNDDAFNNSPAGQLVAGATGSGINLSSTQVVQVAAFLRVINALENIRQSIELLEASGHFGFFGFQRDQVRLAQAIAETEDARKVLASGGLHPHAVAHLKKAEQLTRQAASSLFGRHIFINEAIRKHRDARAVMIDAQS